MTLYDWALENKKFGRKLLEDANEELNNKEGLSIYKITYGSNKLLNWKCSVCGHQYKMSPKKRVRTNCSVCYGRTVMKGYNDAYTWCLSNGEWGEQLIEEFDTEENDLSLDDITYGSNKKIHWKCKRGHKWIAPMGTRAVNGTGCPFCNTNKVSFSETYIYYALASVIPNVERNFRLPKSLGGYELDICIPNHNLVIEYDGAKWHTAPVDGEFPEGSKEYLKSEICKKYGLRLIHIYDGADCSEPVIKSNIIYCKYRSSCTDELQKIISIILNELNVNKEIDYTKVKSKALSEKKSINLDDSLAYSFPGIAAEWDYELNTDYTPETIKPGSTYKAHWIDEYGHRWVASVHNRTSAGNNCPICAGKIALEGFNDLQTKFPQLVKEWHPTLNENLKPTEVTPGSSKRVYWQCTQCGYGENGEWQAVISRRTAKGYETSCPKCRYNWFTRKFFRYLNVHKEVEVYV